MRNLIFSLLLLTSLAQARTYVVPIEGTIDGPLATFVEQSLARAEREGASGVVFRINTPGGRVDAAIRITDRILASSVPTLALVENAFSAGALISLAAQQIMMLPGSNIGAALPVTVTPVVGNTNPADRKVISALKGKFRAVAEARGRPANIAEAMVDPEIEVRGITTKGEPLTLSAKKAVELKVADAEVASLRAALEKAGFSDEVETLEPGPQVRVARFLTDPTIAAILLAVGVLGLVLEFFTPGTFIPAIVGLTSLGLFFLGGYLAGLSSALTVILLFAGLLLVAFELFVTPGFGIPGLVGLGLIGASIYFTFGDEALQVGSYAIIGLVLGLFLMFRYLPKGRAARPFVLSSAVEEKAPPKNELESLLGAIGVALTDLRPAGTAQFGERRVDVVTSGEFIDRGQTIRVIQVEGPRVVVRRVEG
ncbi:MAG: ATP-dependent Clp protease proteolytic subunit [Meiothermus sp.]|uniref:NfeD family protein n=1 Tax=Meiothermus sp. TaxID=1955249 RepID=UPI0025EFA56A|nr:NfeD family protein [Meiothermus sp.]MCS7059481.1 ATP-dependent Clp protease proteolytic subunit [Meiothermus sp.]MCS7194008.1 ATP-dependent Clp protease proteolytic subunit [Meiothermus sp.]MDW8090216.1 NfeD family protein [Meiothermus sp.]